MAEDWHGVAAEVDEAIRSIGQDEKGHPCVLRQRASGSSAADDPHGDFADPLAKGFNYSTVYALEGVKKNFDVNSGVLIIENMLKIGALGAVPTKGDQIAIGHEATQAFIEDQEEDIENRTIDVTWIEIEYVKGYSPGGVVLYYDIKITR